MKTNVKSSLSFALLVSSLAFLPSCDLLKKSSSSSAGSDKSVGTATVGGDNLAVANGKPLVTATEFKNLFNRIIETHPAGQMLATMEGIDRQLFNEILGQKLIGRYVEEQGLDQSPEYKEMLDQIKGNLNRHFFMMKHQPEVTDAEVESYYKEQKEKMPQLLLSRGGVNAVGVSFDSEAAAKELLDKAKGKGAQLATLAKDAGIAEDKIKDFKTVNEYSIGVDSNLRDKILKLKKFPSLDKYKINGNVWVVYASGKEEAKYRPLDQVKDFIKSQLINEKQQEVLQNEIEKLKAKYNVQVDESFFAPKAKEAPAAQQEAEQNMAAVMPDASAQKEPVSPVARAA